MTNNIENAEENRESEATLPRRSVLQALGAGSLALGSSATQVSGAAGNTATAADVDVQDTSIQIGPNLDLGGRLIVGKGLAYQTIEAAWEDAHHGDKIYVHSSYDAQEAGEQFPIVLDNREKEVMLTGGHPSGTVIDAGDTDANVIEVIGRGQADYRNNPIVRNLKITGGNVGLRIRAAPYSMYENLILYETGSHGIQVDEYTDENGDYRGTFGVTFQYCVAWSCEGNGFRLETAARPHSTTFYGCHSMFNGRYGSQTLPGVHMRGYATRWHGGTVQGNGGFGVDARSGATQSVYGAYFEGNGAKRDYPYAIYMTSTAAGFTVESSYFQGGFFRDAPNGRSQSYRAIAIDGTPNVSIKNTTYRNYEDAFLLVRGARDVDIHRTTHVPLDETPFLRQNDAVRIRSDGIVQQADLRDESGGYQGDLGVHDGSGSAQWGLAIWNGSNWVSVMDSQPITSN
ncbi:Right handed beta helix region [Halogranum amylolyticum]|uniref:Right handed beta helix region n=1 Tax=Halogranum amylolyticum TaxID=660520 RepID=A0A1H8WRW1_9EURY|nr:right-handed parallel beta-helix repeat-containing protein [Halogranum amylolyticum]SEP30349.1 Right handed beta helix region [Halogranum amylolyticum]